MSISVKQKILCVYRDMDALPLYSSRRRYHFDEHFFDTIDTEQKAYFLGLLYADGCIPSDRIILALQARDKNIILKLKAAVRYTGPMRQFSVIQKSNKETKVVSLQLCSTHMSTQLAKHGCGPNKTHIISFPTFLRRELVPHFIRGYFDGDGSISCFDRRPNRPIYSCSITSNYNMCKGLAKQIEQYCGVHVTLCRQRKDKLGSTPEATTTTIKISGHIQIKKFMRWIYTGATVFLKRKHTKYLTLERLIPCDVRRPVEQLDRQTGNVLRRFDSVVQAAQATKIAPVNLSRLLNQTPYRVKGRVYTLKSLGGYRWRHA